MVYVAPNFSNAKIIVDSEQYLIKDLELKEGSGRVMCTISKTFLHPDKETRGHSHDKKGETYWFESGKGIMILGDEPAMVYRVGPEAVIYVDKGLKHQVINGSTIDLIFTTLYEGPSERPPIHQQKKSY